MSRGVPRKPSFPPSRPARRQEYSESEREESEYETEGEDIEHSPTGGREELDEDDEYEEDPEEDAPMSDEGIQVRCHCLKLQFSFYKVGSVVNCSNHPI